MLREEDVASLEFFYSRLNPKPSAFLRIIYTRIEAFHELVPTAGVTLEATPSPFIQGWRLKVSLPP